MTRRFVKADTSRYVCAHCDARPPRGDYMVNDVVWANAGMPRRGFLCLSCLETRLVAAGHRPLQLDDFTHVPCNAGIYFGAALAARNIADERGRERISRTIERLFARMYTRRKSA
jgi:hypothetical protein